MTVPRQPTLPNLHDSCVIVSTASLIWSFVTLSFHYDDATASAVPAMADGRSLSMPFGSARGGGLPSLVRFMAGREQASGLGAAIPDSRSVKAANKKGARGLKRGRIQSEVCDVPPMLQATKNRAPGRPADFAFGEIGAGVGLNAATLSLGRVATMGLHDFWQRHRSGWGSSRPAAALTLGLSTHHVFVSTIPNERPRSLWVTSNATG